MNVTEFAEQIVFGTTLDDKLIMPGRLTHERARSATQPFGSLRTPGRPADLQMRHGKGGNAKPPNDDQLENEMARGQLLHFLANHELLATELMALTLLKFPDAPHAFRAGVLVTLQEEQEHTRMYLKRMQECGVEFGSFPLSGQFWRAVEPMQSPLDFVSRLSLTFEQANLDYSLHFANVFRQLGDLETSGLLQKIYEDEIGHVQHGLHWFQKWKNPQLSDWEAYQATLEFPMSPQLGRGPRAAFNREGRRAAGLSEDFIDAIEVFRQSRGRSPTVRWFDPAAEAELAGELDAKTESLMKQLATDLELVMVALAKQDDLLLVHRMPSREIRKHLIDAGIDLPEFVALAETISLAHRKLNRLSPWAWTPKNLAVAKPLIDSTFHPPLPWREDRHDLFRKSWGATKLHEWLNATDCENKIEGTPDCLDWFTPADCAGIAVATVDEVPAALVELAQRGYSMALVKKDLSASGRGQRRLDCRQPLSSNDQAWLRAVLTPNSLVRRNGLADDNQPPFPIGVVEPELDRVLDLSFLWRLPPDTGQAKFLGWTRPLISPGRRYAGTRLGTPLDGCDQELKQFLLPDRAARLQAVADWLEPRLTPELLSRHFTGHFGVDAFVCRDNEGQLKIKPLVELNPRLTMGHIALSLKKRFAPGSEALFRIFSKPEYDLLRHELEQIPMIDSRDGWKTGVIWLGEVDANTKLIPALLIGKKAISIAMIE